MYVCMYTWWDPTRRPCGQGVQRRRKRRCTSTSYVLVPSNVLANSDTPFIFSSLMSACCRVGGRQVGVFFSLWNNSWNFCHNSQSSRLSRVVQPSSPESWGTGQAPVLWCGVGVGGRQWRAESALPPNGCLAAVMNAWLHTFLLCFNYALCCFQVAFLLYRHA